MAKRRILFVTANPGSVSAVMPAYRLAAEHYDCRYLDVGAAERPYPVTKAMAETEAFDPALLVCGTGALESQDKAFLEAALAKGIPTLAVIDFWAIRMRGFRNRAAGFTFPMRSPFRTKSRHAIWRISAYREPYGLRRARPLRRPAGRPAAERQTGSQAEARHPRDCFRRPHADATLRRNLSRRRPRTGNPGLSRGRHSRFAVHRAKELGR